jgi:hypothetical protein
VFFRRWLVLVGIVALVIIVLVVASGGRPMALYWQGEPIVNSSSVLSQAQSDMQAVASADEGALSGQSRCYFALPGRSSHDVEPYLRCGPVLLPWSSSSAPWLTYPLSASSASSGALLALVRATPTITGPLAKGEVLRRPDGVGPPKGDAGLTVPVVPRQLLGWAGVASGLPAGLHPAPANDLVGGWGRSYRLVAYGEDGRLDARLDPAALREAFNPPGSGYATTPSDHRTLAKLLLPQSGEVFVLAQLAVGPGEAAGAVPSGAAGGTSAGPDQPVLEVLAGKTVATFQAVPGSGVVTLIAVVPAHSRPVLQFSDKGLVQTLSLSNGQLGPGPSVLSRAGTDEPLSVTGQLPGVAVSVSDVSLVWFAGSDGGTVPPAADEAYLQVLASASPQGASFLPPSDFTLDEAGGQVVPAQALPDSDRQAIVVGFLVPASFSEGTVVVSAGGQAFDVKVHFP